MSEYLISVRLQTLISTRLDGSTSVLEEPIRKYGGVIVLSISSAQVMFTIAEDAKSLFNVLKTGTTQDEIKEYLTGMSSLAEGGLEEIKQTLQVFKNVRADVISASTLILMVRELTLTYQRID